MKKILPGLLLLISLGATAQDSYKMSLQEAIDYAVKSQPAFQNYKVDEQIASAKRLQSTSEYLPKISGSANMQYNTQLPSVALKFPNPVTGETQNLKIQQGTKYQGSGSLDLVQPIIDASIIADLKASKQQQQLSNVQYQQALIDLKINISRIYYLALLNTERLKKTQKNVERDQRTYDDTRVKYDNQSVIKTDMDRAYLNLQNSKYQLKLAQDSIKTSTSNLAQLIGLPLNSKLELTDAMPLEIKVETLPEYPDYASAEKARIEIKAESMQQSLNIMQRNKVNYGYIPTLSGMASYGGVGLDNSKLFQKGSWYQTSYIGIRLSVPIFDGLQKLALAQQQKLAITKNTNNINSIKQTINYQLQTTSVNYLNAYDNARLLRDNVKLAEEVMREVNLRYQNSLATYQEMLDAENTLKETEFNYLQAVFAFLIADLDWKKANGRL